MSQETQSSVTLDVSSDDSDSRSDTEVETQDEDEKESDNENFFTPKSSGTATPVRERVSLGLEQEPPAVPKKRGRPPGVKNGPKIAIPESSIKTRDRSGIRQPQRFGLLLKRGEEPRNVQEAFASEDKDLWTAAMQEELRSLGKHKCWTLVKKPPDDFNIVGCMWVFRIKPNADGSLGRYKARLCAQGFTQEKDVDYKEIFSPVVRYDAIRVFLSVVAQEKLYLKQFDVKTAFLYGKLEEEIWMKQPPGFDDGSGRVCKLLKGLYGLKQSPRTWNEKLDTHLREAGLRRSDADHCVYVSSGKDMLILALYVDDGLVACKTESRLRKFLDTLGKVFEITVSEPRMYVGMEIDYDRKAGTLKITQKNYIHRLLDRFNMSECKPVITPGISKERLTRKPDTGKRNRKDMSEVPYRQMVGSLMYAVQVSRPDVAFQVSCVAKYMTDPQEVHWTAAKRILRYLAGTAGHGIEYGPEKHTLEGFCDASYNSDPDTGKSVTGFLFTLNRGVITWSSRMQETVAQSTTESEYIALAECAKETVWLRQLCA